MSDTNKHQVAAPGIRPVPGQKDFVKVVPKEKLAGQTRTRRPGEAGKEEAPKPAE